MTRKYAPRTAVNGGSAETGPCVEQSRGTQPTLQQMTDKAIKLLDNPNGFFLQVEGASVDKAEHERDICGAIGELEELDQAVRTALDYQRTHPDTLVIVTGDHAHSTQIVMDNYGGSATATVTTSDGDPMTVAYSSSYAGTPPQQATHAGAQIRVAAVGPQAANVTGVIDQTDLFATMLGRTPSTLYAIPLPTPPGARVRASLSKVRMPCDDLPATLRHPPRRGAGQHPPDRLDPVGLRGVRLARPRHLQRPARAAARRDRPAVRGGVRPRRRAAQRQGPRDGQPDRRGGQGLPGRRVPHRELARDEHRRQRRPLRRAARVRHGDDPRRSTSPRTGCGPASSPAPPSRCTTPTR